MDYFNACQQLEISKMDGFSPEGYAVFNKVNFDTDGISDLALTEKLNNLNEIDINNLKSFIGTIITKYRKYIIEQELDPNDTDDDPISPIYEAELNVCLNRFLNRIKKLRELDPRLHEEHPDLQDPRPSPEEPKGGRHHKKSKRRKLKRRKSKRRKSKRRKSKRKNQKEKNQKEGYK
jgi:hypothetical protein